MKCGVPGRGNDGANWNAWQKTLVRSSQRELKHGGGRSQSDLKSAEFPNKNRRRSLKARGLNSRCVEIRVFDEGVGRGGRIKKKRIKKRRIPFPLALATHRHGNGFAAIRLPLSDAQKARRRVLELQNKQLVRETRAGERGGGNE